MVTIASDDGSPNAGRSIELLNETWRRAPGGREPVRCGACAEEFEDGDSVVHHAGSLYHSHCATGQDGDRR